MHPIYRNLEPVPIGKVVEPPYAYNPNIKTYYDPPRQSVGDSVVVINKQTKNGIGLVQHTNPKQSQNLNSLQLSSRQLNSPSEGRNNHIQINDILPALKQLELRVVSLSQAVLHHQQILTNNSLSKAFLQTNQSTNHLTKIIQEEIQKRLEISSSKSHQSNSLESSKLSIEVLNLRQEIMKESKQKSFQDRKYLADILKRETQTQIQSMYEANREVFRRIQIDMNQLRELIQTSKQSLYKQIQEHQPSLFSSNRKFYDPRIIRYREVMERIDVSSPFNSPNKSISDAVTVNQILYYLDKDCYLLDGMSNYLLDAQGQTIRLEEKHINILKGHGLLN